jgi:hypothetical protein
VILRVVSTASRVRVRVLVVALVLASASTARADDEPDPAETTDPAALFKGALDALGHERPGEAIGKLEALGDRGVVDPVVSYNRGLAYAARVRAGSEQAGDLGRAAHGFEEARDLTNDALLAADATSALGIVRSEIARRRSRAGDPVEIAHGFSLGRSIVNLLSENAWAVIAGIMALVLSASIVGRRVVQLGRAKVAATTAAAVTGALLLVASGLAWAARDARLHLREGIVVTPNARLLDDRHLARSGVSPLAEGVRVRIVEESGGYSKIVASGVEGVLPTSAVLPLAKR